MRYAQATLLATALLATLAPSDARGQEHAEDGHDHQPRPHATVLDGSRFTTSRRSPIELPLPGEEDAFLFAVFGDRTGGPAAGIEILREAVAEVNLFEPDLVMTVGDLIEGYNETPRWLEQMGEFRGAMDQLLCPWFPVAGNHDVYWRGEGPRPPREHEGNYELHFGPLWYAFEHKGVWFIVLYTDEGDPETGVRTFREPASQRMSPEQLAWLESILDRAQDAHSVLVFLHHPRWIGGGYGDDWERVHGVLAAAGNVRAVFAGHIHHMRYDGARDGIEYFALATVGGHQSAVAPEAGYLHQYHLVTVRQSQLAVAALPVGSAFDPRAITAEVSADARRVALEMRPRFGLAPALEDDLGVDGELRVTLHNPVARPVEVTLTPDSRDARWRFHPDHAHFEVAGGASSEARFRVSRPAAALDDAFRLPEIVLAREYLTPATSGLRIALPSLRVNIPMDLSALPAPAGTGEAGEQLDRALALDGQSAYAEVGPDGLELGDGPLTVEGWVRAQERRPHQALVDRSEGGGFGLYLEALRPRFSVHVDGSYRVAEPREPALSPGTWHHLAGVFDGAQLALFVDGRRIAEVAARGARTPSPDSLLIGDGVRSDVGGHWNFPGSIDELRITRAALYGEDFEPAHRLDAGPDTALLLHMDAATGPFLYDSSPARAHGRLAGGAQLLPE